MASAADLAALGPALYARLRELVAEEGESDEDLAARLGTPAKDISRLKGGFGPNQVKLLGLLKVVGWLSPEAALSPEEAKERVRLYQQTRRIQRRQRRNGQEEN